MNNRQEVKAILEEYHRLHARQAVLVARLAVLSQGEARISSEVLNSPSRSAYKQTSPTNNRSLRQEHTVNTLSSFTVGEEEEILNRRKQQARCGIVVEIGPRFVTVETDDGTRIDREPHNLKRQSITF